MHVMTKYLDTRKAAISALQDFAVMEQIIDTTDEQDSLLGETERIIG